jgi:hypothetical protein
MSNLPSAFKSPKGEVHRSPSQTEQETIMPPLVRRAGLWSGTAYAILNVVYTGLLIATFIIGFPPVEPYQTMIHVLTLCGAALLVLLWSVLHSAAPNEKKLFSRASLAMIVIMATLTSINRYVALTVVRQSLASGNSSGLQWFLPYSWPSVSLAIEVLAWGYFFGLACLLLAPVFSQGKLERGIFWTLILTGVLSLLAALGQVFYPTPLILAGFLAWGPGLTLVAVLIVIWFTKARTQS